MLPLDTELFDSKSNLLEASVNDDKQVNGDIKTNQDDWYISNLEIGLYIDHVEADEIVADLQNYELVECA